MNPLTNIRSRHLFEYFVDWKNSSNFEIWHKWRLDHMFCDDANPCRLNKDGKMCPLPHYTITTVRNSDECNE
jgi:hypothetical protein